jgi:dihydroneopterin aldolase
VVTDVLFVRGIEVDAVIGIYHYERHEPQKLRVSLELELDTRPAAAEDDARLTVDYDQAVKIATDILTQGEFRLIETGAEEIAQAILAAHQVDAVTIELIKPDAIAGPPEAGVRIRRARRS